MRWKKSSLLFLLSLLFSGVAFGQKTAVPAKDTSNDLNVIMGFGLGVTRVVGLPTFGINFDIGVYPTRRWLSALTFAGGSRKTPFSFGYAVGKPSVSYVEFGWLNQYQTLDYKRWQFGVNLTNGLAISTLGDRAQMQTYWTGKTVSSRPKTIATEYYYLLQPGAALSFRLNKPNAKTPALRLTAVARYRYLLGGGKFTTADDYNGLYYSLGITFSDFPPKEAKGEKEKR